MINLWKLYNKGDFSEITARVAHRLRTAVLMVRAFCLQDPRTSKILCRLTLYSSCTQPKTRQLLIPRGCRRRDDGWRQEHTARTRGPGRRGRGHRARQGEKPPRRATTRRRAMHPTIVINGGKIVAASHLTAGRRRQVPLRQRDELSPRLRRTVDFRSVPRYPVRCCIVSRW